MRAAVLALAFALAGCSSVCDKEFLPNKGDTATPEHTVEILQYACAKECWSLLYDLTSEKTRDKYSYLKFRVAFPSLKAPGREETVHELVARTHDILVAHSHLGDEFRLAYLTYEEGGEKKDLNVLLIQEGEQWHVALEEQVEKKVSFE
jgi:hypothetical protein